jgi:cytidylate kinase
MISVVAISRQFGSGGARVGRALAQRLGYRYADREILTEAARTLRVEANDLEPLEEQTTGFWTRIGLLFAHGSPDTPFIPPSLPTVTESQLAAIEQRIVRELASRGSVVIVGRGAPHVLEPSAGLLRVFLHAPLEIRVALAMSEYGFAGREEAKTVAQASDKTRSAFARTLTGRDWTDATLYDVTLDTAAVGLDRAVDLLVDLVQRPPAAPLGPVAPRTSANRDPR